MKALLVLVSLLFTSCGYYIVDPGNRGVKVTLGSTSNELLSEGFGLKLPIVTGVTEVSIRQETKEVKADCFSSDLQRLEVDVNLMYRIPEASVIKIFKDYSGNPFDSLIAPRVYESLKEVTATMTAEGIAKNRETIKTQALELIRKKVGTILVVEDLMVKNVALSKELTDAIESKMVQQQEAAKAVFTKQKALVEAETAIIKAEGQAKALRIQGDAIRANPETLKMELIKKWDGVSPRVVSGVGGTSVILPMAKDEK